LEEHLKNLQDIFNIIKENGLKVNLSKCHFLKKECISIYKRFLIILYYIIVLLHNKLNKIK